jgi:hypothetical protein
MTKVLNQLLYSSVVFGSELPSGMLTLESTSSGTKGRVQIIGTQFDFIVNNQLGSLTHSNSGARLYSLPDYSGQVLISGIFTAANQMVYSSAPGVYAMLPNTLGGALVTGATGTIHWAAGTTAQVLTIVAGAPVFANLPDVGFINPSPAANQIPYYAAIGNVLSPLTTVNSRALLSTAIGTLAWSLISAPYLEASGGVPLGSGISTQVLTAVGDGSFAWVNANPAVINPGTQYRLPYYSVAPTGTTISNSNFLQTDEILHTLSLLNRGGIRFYEATVNGSSYLQFQAPLSLGPSTVWTLPATDGLPGALLVTDGFGNLNFSIIDNGTVYAGLINQITYYAATGNKVSGLTTVSDRLLASPLGVPSWILLTETYLSTTGSLPLGAGTLNQVLVSNGAANFLWANAVDITGEVLSGTANYLAYYPNTGTKVDDTSFLSIDNTLHILNLLQGAYLRFFPASGSNYLGFQAPPTVLASISWVLPASDGLNGYALTTDGIGNLSFIKVGRGIVHTGTPLTLAYYQSTTDEVYPWANSASLTLLTNALNEISWGLITTEYLSGTGGVPLDVGTPNYVLTPDGLGSFSWIDITSITGKVNPGQATHLAYYQANNSQVYSSTWINNNEGSLALEFLNGGSIRLYTSSNTIFAGLLASPSMLGSVNWYLPLIDATAAGQALVSDGAGNLSFSDLVDNGVQDAVATYQNGASNRVSPSINFFNPSTGLLLKGSTFIMSGNSGVTPTIVSLLSGNNTAGVGANLYLASGTGTTTAGSTIIGSGANNYLSVDDSGWVSILNQASLRFYDSGVNYVGFKAPTTVSSSLIWTLPAADGLSGQFLQTNGTGILSWITNKINTGVLNAIPYYSALNELSASTLLIPSGLPLAAGSTLLVDQITGQLSYAVTVQPAATAGEIAVYTAPQTVGYYSNLTWDSVNKLIKVGSGGGLSLFEVTNTYYTLLQASPSLASSFALTLPPSLPAQNGYVLSGEIDGTLSFVEPSSDTRWQKRGVITLTPGMRTVTVIYDTPYTQPPTWVNVQWMIGDDNDFLATYAIERSTEEGFIVKFSTTVPVVGTYKINWQSYLTSVISGVISMYIAGGRDGSGYLNSLQQMLVDINTSITLATTLSSNRSYTCAGSSTLIGYIFGGSSSIPLPLNVITSYVYSTLVLTDISTTLITARSAAAGVGTRSTVYVAGGQTPGGANYSTIEAFNTTTEAISSLGVTLTYPGTSTGATSYTKGAIVPIGVDAIDILTYATNTITASGATFGYIDISVGANDTASGIGYFGRDAGYVYSYNFAADTLTVLPNILNSITGLSSAGNSLDTAFFAGASLMDALDYTTNTVQTVANMASSTNMSASGSTFQTKGLL